MDILVLEDSGFLNAIQAEIESTGNQSRIRVYGLNSGTWDELMLSSFDLVAIHDAFTDPEAVFRAAKKLAGHATTVTASTLELSDHFSGDRGDVVAPLAYGLSLMFALPVSKAASSAELGCTVRNGQVERLAIRAGFQAVRFIKMEGETLCVLQP